MAMNVNSVISNYTYTYNSKMQAKLDKNDDAVWSKDELQNYADDYAKATGKTLDVDAIFEKYSNEDGVIDYAAQQRMHDDDAMGFSTLKSLADSQAGSTSSTASAASSTTTATAANSAAQRNAIFDAVNGFTFQYGGKLQPLLDKDDNGMWSREELDNYAAAYKKATGNELDVDAIVEKYGNEDGNIDPTNQAAMKKDDALGMTALKTAYDNAITARNEAINTTEPYKGYTKDTTIYGKASSDFSVQDLLGSMSSSQKMAFSLGINRLDNQSALLSSMFGGTSNSASSYMLNLVSSSNASQMYSSVASSGNSDAVYAAMSGQLMNFTF